MARYINAVEAAEKVAEATGIPLADLVDIFAKVPAADVAPVRRGHWIEAPFESIWPGDFDTDGNVIVHT